MSLGLLLLKIRKIRSAVPAANRLQMEDQVVLVLLRHRAQKIVAPTALATDNSAGDVRQISPRLCTPASRTRVDRLELGKQILVLAKRQLDPRHLVGRAMPRRDTLRDPIGE